MDTEIVARDDDDAEDSGLVARQVAALEKLEALGAAPREDGKPYSPDRRVRAQQLIYEGRMGGPNMGQGRKRQTRASEAVAEYVRETLTPKIQAALKDGLSNSQDITIRLKTADMALKAEREEASLQLREEQADLEQSDKGELIAALIALVGDPGTQAALEAAIEDSPEFIDIPDSSVTEITQDSNGNGRTAEPPRSQDNGVASILEETGANSSEVGSNGSSDTTGSSSQRPNPFTQAARRRSANRRRVT